VIRPARPGDAAALGAMHAASWAETYAGLLPAALVAEMSDPVRRAAAWAAMLAASRLPDGTWVAEEAGKILGFVDACPSRDPALGTAGEIAGLYLLKAAQGRGLATALLQAGFGALRAAGYRDAGAWAMVGNTPAERFYAARGARPGPRRIEHRGAYAFPQTGWIWTEPGPRP
jgi:GNAT superfamily N-acetyltransferase